MSGWLVAYGVAALVPAVTAAVLWRYRAGAAAVLLVTMAGLVLWSGSDALRYLGWGLRAQVALAAPLYLGVSMVVVSLYCCARLVADPTYRLRPSRLAWLAIQPVAVQVALATNGVHHAFYTSTTLVGSPPTLATTFGVLFYVNVAYTYVLIAVTGVVTVRMRRTAPAAVRRQVTTLALGVALPVIANVVALATGVAADADPTALCFTAAGLISTWAVLRQGAISVVPVGRGQIIETMGDGVIVVDPLGRIVELNTQARRMLEAAGRPVPHRAAGCPALEVLGVEVVEAIQAGRERLALTGVRDADMRLTALRDTRGRALGTVLVARDTTEANAQRVALEAANRRLAEQLATIERLRADLAEDAVRDPLTGLHNRRYLNAELEAAVVAAKASPSPVALVIVDLDHFKAINDQHGHQVGDRALEATARVLADCVRAGDTVARFGGEEFVLVLPGLDASAAAERAEEVRARLAQVLVRSGRSVVGFTASAGVAAVPGDAGDAESLIGAADRALYAAKAAGRNRVHRADAAHPARP